MKKFYVFIPFVACLSAATDVNSQECPVDKFTKEHMESIKFSQSLSLALANNLDRLQDSDKRSDFNSGFLVKGIPVKINFSEMKSVSEHIQINNSLNYSKDDQLNYFTSNISLLGKEMYEACLKNKSQNFSIDIPKSAYADDEFLVTVRWTPKHSVQGTPDVFAEVEVVNGRVDGEETSKKIIKDQKVAKFRISKSDKSKNIQIITTVDGYDGSQAHVVIPPVMPRKFVTVLRQWNGSDLGKTGDHGSHYGAHVKRTTECISASPNGMLLPSTFHIVHKNQGPVHIQKLSDNDYSKVCAEFGTAEGVGKGGYSELTSLGMFVYEVVPEETTN